jgi:4-hydroxy-3-methylbut-2-enyl diphosphate reductase
VADVCTATHERQSAVARFVQEGGDGVLVVGSATSSNTRRLAEIARAAGARVFCVADASALAGCDFSAVTHLGVTGGASTPEDCLTEVMKQLEGDCK